MKKVLHISNWYPNQWNDMEATFVREQYRLFSKVTESHLVHIQVRKSKKIFAYKYIKYSSIEEGYYFLTKLKSTKIIEILTTFLLLWVLLKSKYKHYNILHFHIAYPLLSYYSWWKKILKKPILISEHWSAYHFNFYMSLKTKKLDRIKNIFKQNIPLITVSKTLLEDIEKFSGTNSLISTIIPNVIDQKTFFYHPKNINNTVTFFAVNDWRVIKNPFPMLEGFALLYDKGISFKLILGGYGELIEEMKNFVSSHGMLDKIVFLGKMHKKEIASVLYQSDGYLIASNYETFSVVSAQALCCGVPLIGVKLSAIEEYTNEDSYLNLEDNSAEGWRDKLEYFMYNKNNYNRKDIALKGNTYLSNENIKISYKKTLEKWF